MLTVECTKKVRVVLKILLELAFNENSSERNEKRAC